MLAFGEEVSGYDIKKWADWSVGYFYWSPSFSQVYSELKRLESHGYATSRVQHDGGLRGRRTYKITESGQQAVSKWATEAPIDPPMLKHGVLLRVWLGHLNEPDRLKQILQEHIAYVDNMRQRVATDSEAAALRTGLGLSADRHAMVGALLRRRARARVTADQGHRRGRRGLQAGQA